MLADDSHRRPYEREEVMAQYSRMVWHATPPRSANSAGWHVIAAMPASRH